MNDRENVIAGLQTRICPTWLCPSRTHLGISKYFFSFCSLARQVSHKESNGCGNQVNEPFLLEKYLVIMFVSNHFLYL